jgi:PAS domain-containing protein
MRFRKCPLPDFVQHIVRDSLQFNVLDISDDFGTWGWSVVSTLSVNNRDIRKSALFVTFALLVSVAALRHRIGAQVLWECPDALLRRSDRELRDVIETIPVMAWSAAADGTAEFFNRRWLDYAGLSAGQVHLRPEDDVVDDLVVDHVVIQRKEIGIGFRWRPDTMGAYKIRRAFPSFRSDGGPEHNGKGPAITVDP